MYNLNLDTQTAKQLFDYYHKKIQTHPDYGRLGNGGVTITLPEDLSWEYANKCAGDSGGEGARPVGIRLEPGVVKKIWGTQENAMKSIWSSTTSLQSTINKHGGGGAEHLARKLVNKAVHRSNLEKSDVMKKAMIDALIDMAIELEDSMK